MYKVKFICTDLLVFHDQSSEHSRSWVVDISRINFKDDIGCTCGECL
ncbi:unnamed protein product, partial [Vitis vinifera]|uniref:Uncharacterized protein n=1 Tax=Vitis vinifera TaxID=29760 RepID=D7U4G9_VITVI